MNKVMIDGIGLAVCSAGLVALKIRDKVKRENYIKEHWREFHGDEPIRVVRCKVRDAK